MKHIVYVPGLGYNFNPDLSMEAYANRLRIALENNKPPKLKYEIKVTKAKYGAKSKYFSDIATITETDGKSTTTIYKIYEFKYGDELITSFKKSNKFTQLMLVTFAIAGRSVAIVKSWFRPNGMSVKQQFQTIWMLLLALSAMVLALSVFAAILTTTGAVLAQYMANGNLKHFEDWLHTHKPAMLSWLDKKSLKTISLGIESFISALFLFNSKYKDTFYQSTTEFLCAHNYLKYGLCRPVILGKMDMLLQKIAEEEPEEDEISIHAYSFGSVIALDFLYPFGHPPSKLVINRVSTFVSVGCPFDFIRTYYPNFYKGRIDYKLSLNKWLNVCSSTDILSSNFRNDNKNAEANVAIVNGGLLPQNVIYDTINPKTLKFTDYLMLISIKAHRMYWDSDIVGQSFMGTVVELL
jgi:hypothetical protein